MGYEPPHQFDVIQTNARVALRRTVHAPWIRGMRERDPGLRKGRSNDVSSRTLARACRAHVQQDTGAAALASAYEAVVGRVPEAHDQVLAILVQPDRPFDAFNHPYAYAGAHRLCGE